MSSHIPAYWNTNRAIAAVDKTATIACMAFAFAQLLLVGNWEEDGTVGGFPVGLGTPELGSAVGEGPWLVTGCVFVGVGPWLPTTGVFVGVGEGTWLPPGQRYRTDRAERRWRQCVSDCVCGVRIPLEND